MEKYRKVTLDSYPVLTVILLRIVENSMCGEKILPTLEAPNFLLYFK